MPVPSGLAGGPSPLPGQPNQDHHLVWHHHLRRLTLRPRYPEVPHGTCVMPADLVVMKEVH